MVKSIIKRVIVAVSVALILGYIGSLTGFIIPVYAESGGGGGSFFEFDGQPLIGISSSSDSSQVSVSNGLTSNVFYNTSTRYDFNYYQFAIAPGSDMCSSVSCYKMSSPTPGFNTSDIRNSHSIDLSTGGSIPSNERYVYISTFYTTFTNSLLLKKGNHYTYLVVFDVSDGVTLSPNDRNNYVVSAINVSNSYNVLSSYNIINDVENLSSNYYRFDSESYGNKRYAYLSVEFDLPVSFNEQEVYLSDIWVEYNGYSDNPIDVPFNYIMYSRGDNSHYFDTNVYFFENGIFDFYDSRQDNFDYVLPQDYDVIDSISSCSSTDIVCHIKRVFEMIEKFFIRISNFFRDLLNDSFDVSIDSNNDMTPISNIVNMPLTMLNKFINGFSNQCYTFNLGSLLGTNLFINCIDVESYLGSNLWGLIDIFISIFMCFNIMSLILMFFDKWTSFEDTFQLMYYPRHANTTEDYISRHGGR